ncbi:hypothetical protein SEUCBS139899_005913 [Sporothrix eucalyptigena]|uniref:Beta/gamma crystallin 'Greek key' domain-containing protein n=1 Tax=Sporothrix eucalyptigena TaxID=1812306 RepID=A0ABP0AX95_9PEZI
MKNIAALVALVAIVAALPAPAQESAAAVDTASRRRLEMTFCRVENFEDCDIIESAEHDVCNTVPPALLDRIRSISFHGADQCTFYNAFDCSGNNFTDAGTVPELHRRFRDRVSSYRCT